MANLSSSNPPRETDRELEPTGDGGGRPDEKVKARSGGEQASSSALQEVQQDLSKIMDYAVNSAPVIFAEVAVFGVGVPAAVVADLAATAAARKIEGVLSNTSLPLDVESRIRDDVRRQVHNSARGLDGESAAHRLERGDESLSGPVDGNGPLQSKGPESPFLPDFSIKRKDDGAPWDFSPPRMRQEAAPSRGSLPDLSIKDTLGKKTRRVTF